MDDASGPHLSHMLMPIISKIMEATSQLRPPVDLSLPQICVVGSQSAGKSSVLENIVGQSLFPRGTGIVTRVPLILRLHAPDLNESSAAARDPGAPDPKDGSLRVEWCEFSHLPGQRFFDFEAGRNEIARYTDELAGSDRGVIDRPIFATVFAPRLLELTLVDLPGITKVPVGEQPADIEEKIRKLCLKYIEKENSIILVSTTAFVCLFLVIIHFANKHKSGHHCGKHGPLK